MYAASQTFNSMGCAFGSMICFASYNKYNNNILQDTIAVWVVNGVTSLLVGVFAFATIGNIATEQGTSIEDVLDDGKINNYFIFKCFLWHIDSFLLMPYSKLIRNMKYGTIFDLL